MPAGALQAVNHQGTGEGCSCLHDAPAALCSALQAALVDAPPFPFPRLPPTHLPPPSPAAPCLPPAGAEVFVAPGFTLPSFVASTSFGAGRLFVDGMVAQNATLLLSG